MMTRVLHIEDDEVNRKIVRDLLTRKGYEVVEACDGEQGVRLAKTAHPDIILMDIQLPLVNGYEATRQIRRIPGCEVVPIIAVTSYALSGDEEQARAAGANAYMAKPYDPIVLLGLVAQWAR